MKAGMAMLFLMLSAVLLAACGTQTTDIEDNSGDYREMNITIEAGGRTFDAVLYANTAADEIADCLPFTLSMSELNGNEKYYYFDESFSTSYSYTPIGRILNPEGLEEALGRGSIKVAFSAE